MLLLKTLGGLAVAAVALAADSPVIHDVQVGKSDHAFSPTEVDAQIGDIIRYSFFPENHSVVRAEYDAPCQPIEYGRIGFPPLFSGFHPVEAGKPSPTFEFTVNDTEPIFVYCAAPDACIGHGMVAVVWVAGNKTNPKASQGVRYSFEELYGTARKQKYQLAPGEQPPSEAVSSTASPSPTETATHDEDDIKPHPHGLSKGAIAGIVVGSIAGVALIAILVYLFGRNKSLSETLRYSRPPAGKIAPLPAMSEGPQSPYPPSSFPASPAFPHEAKLDTPMGVPAPGYNHMDNNHPAHQSWMSQTPTMRAQSPDSMAERGYTHGGLMSPNAFSPHNSYVPQQQQQMQQPATYHMQSSPSETPWSPGGYNWQNVQAQHEMGAGQEGIATQRQSQQNNGYPTPSHQVAPVELAGETSENVAAPPVYRPAVDGETAPNPEDKTPAVTTRDA